MCSPCDALSKQNVWDYSFVITCAGHHHSSKAQIELLIMTRVQAISALADRNSVKEGENGREAPNMIQTHLRYAHVVVITIIFHNVSVQVISALADRNSGKEGENGREAPNMIQTHLRYAYTVVVVTIIFHNVSVQVISALADRNSVKEGENGREAPNMI